VRKGPDPYGEKPKTVRESRGRRMPRGVKTGEAAFQLTEERVKEEVPFGRENSEKTEKRKRTVVQKKDKEETRKEVKR